MKAEEKREWAEERLDGDPDDPGCPVFFDGLDAAIIGVGNQYTKPDLVVYDARLIVKALMKQGMDYETAAEYASFNILDLWAGDGTPIIVTSPD